MLLLAIATALLANTGVAATVPAAAEVRTLYQEHCASCHGARRYGGYAPPLIPQTLGSKDDEALTRAIVEGLPNTQMAAFRKVVDDEQARGLAGLLREPLGEIRWSEEDIAASRREIPLDVGALPARIRRENLTLVVERGTASVSVVDGDSLIELDRYPVGRIHGGLKFDRRFRRVFASTRDGTVVEYDLVRGGLRTKVKVGVNTRNIAVSPDGDFIAAANQLPAGLVVLDAQLKPQKVFPLEGQPSAVYHLPGSDRFILTLRTAPLLYSVRTTDFSLRTLELPEPFEDFVFVPGRSQLVASSRGGSRLLLYDYESERVLATLPTRGLPHLFSACFFTREGALYAAFNHLGVPLLSVVDMQSFRIEKEFPLRGPGFFARTHPGSPYIWVDTNTEAIQLVEKETLELLEEALTPKPGKMAMHIEFTADGKQALVSVWDDDGAVVIYDSASLEERGRLPYVMPVGKYNAGNKTRLLH
jgi:hypothetical protein